MGSNSFDHYSKENRNESNFARISKQKYQNLSFQSLNYIAFSKFEEAGLGQDDCYFPPVSNSIIEKLPGRILIDCYRIDRKFNTGFYKLNITNGCVSSEKCIYEFPSFRNKANGGERHYKI